MNDVIRNYAEVNSNYFISALRDERLDLFPFAFEIGEEYGVQGVETMQNGSKRYIISKMTDGEYEIMGEIRQEISKSNAQKLNSEEVKE